MKLAITKDLFALGLQAVQNVVGSRTTLPILSNVLLQAEDNRLRLTATDLDVTVSCLVEAKVVRKGATTLPAKRLFSIVREAAVGEIDLEVDDNNVCTLRSGPSLFKVRGLAAEDFPPVAPFEEPTPVTLPQDRLRGMLRRCAFAASSDETRYVLNGIFFSLKEHKVAAVATDGRRLALTDEEADIESAVNAEFIVPTKAVNELLRLLQDKGSVELRYSENQAAFKLTDEKGGMILVTTKLVEGTYPNYQQVIPRECKERVTLVREEFLHALRRAEIMTSDKSNSVKLNFSRNSLVITANAPEVGEAHETVAINYKGNELAVAFNPAFLVEALRALDTEEVFLELTDELSPGVLKINGPFLYVIMPMRTN
ncbi:MAG: DNA polymerase III subunit beta [Verrucomicrobia bacterium]|nr:DNA polymerase III subunit beta [Verrucomicrobiota bacterium]